LPKLPRLTPQEAEAMLLSAGFNMLSGKGSHRIYIKGSKRVIIPFHTGKILHPKIVKQIFKCIEETGHNLGS
jgi:predicted RNA binding protein YcfA (HicA-like mRNA interferase family)